ncbi:MAG: S9 family peptidase [Acidobacteriota bacterium]|nr:S9 family peptidase [Acidobacteriota bacterium]
MSGRKLRIFTLTIGASFGFLAVNSAISQDDVPQERSPAHGKTSADGTDVTRKPARAKAGTKQAVEARLKEVEKPGTASAIHGVERALFATHEFRQAVISPDGKRVAWVEMLIGKDGALSGNTAIYFSGVDGKAATTRLRAARGAVDHEETNVAWSPDGKRIAFLSDAVKAGQRQLYVANIGPVDNPKSTGTDRTSGAAGVGGAAKKMTSVKGYLDAPKWSPDGKTIAVLFTENATRASGPLVAETPATGEIKDAFFEQRLAVVDVASGKMRQISPADTYIYEYDWSPDGLRFAVTAALGNGDNNWWVAELYTLEGTSGLMKSIYKPKLQIAIPAWSPDGERVAFIEGLMSDAGLTGGDIHTVSMTGGEAENVTPEMKASASWLAWTADKKIVFGQWVEGDAGIATVDPDNNKPETLWRGGECLTAVEGGYCPTLSVAKDGKTMAFVRQSYAAAPEVWAGQLGGWKQITHRNEGVIRAWGDAKSIQWKSGGHEVQGWLLYPRDFDAAKKYPLVVSVHGGPSWAASSQWPTPHNYAAALAGAGYFVLSPNPRGSYGQGEAFARANVKDFGGGDFEDILAGVDEAIRVAPIDANRLGLTGWSYGGFMTMLGVTKTNRFKAAMAGAGISNWQSYYGENQIDQWMIPFFGKSVYDDPEIYAKASALNFIKKVKTPTLIIVGDSDGECPTPQSYEFWHALKAQGVETQLVVYEHEGHMFVKPEHQRDVIERTLAWFDGHLK